MVGVYVACRCGYVYAARYDSEAAHIDHPDPEKWAADMSFGVM
jgi:hypothetical protein